MRRFFPVVLVVLCACTKSGTPLQDTNLTEVTLPNGQKIQAETMLRDVDLIRGMMFRDSLGKDRGVLLVYSAETPHTAFTYNVRIPLDLVWINRGLQIVEIVANAPPCTSSSAKQCPFYGGKAKSRYLLELNAGAAAAHGLKVGDRLRF
jgi:hypothetical protein